VALCLVASLTVAGALRSQADDESGRTGTQVSTGAWITPLAAPGSAIYELHTDLRSDDNADAANAVTSALSPDGTTLLILTTGYNTGFSKEDGRPIAYPVLDPVTGQPDWQTVLAELDPDNPGEAPGIYDVKSGSADLSLAGTAYSEW